MTTIQNDHTSSDVNFSDLLQAELTPLIIREIKLHTVPTVSVRVQTEEAGDIQEQEENVPQFLEINLEPEINDVEEVLADPPQDESTIPLYEISRATRPRLSTRLANGVFRFIPAWKSWI